MPRTSVAGQVLLTCSVDGQTVECGHSLLKDHAGGWQHVVASVDQKLLSLYCNGRCGERRPLHTLFASRALPAPDAAAWVLGARPAGGGEHQHFLDGVLVSYVRAWGDVATPTQATQLYLDCQNEGSGAAPGAPPLPSPDVESPLSPGALMADTAAEDLALTDHAAGTAIRLLPQRLVLHLLLQEGSGQMLHNAAPPAGVPGATPGGAEVKLHGDIEWVCPDLGPLSAEDDFKTLADSEEEKEEETEEGMTRADWHADWKGLDYVQLRHACIEVSAAATIIGARLGVLALIRTTTRTLASPAGAAGAPALALPDLAQGGCGLAQALIHVAQTRSNVIAPEDIEVASARLCSAHLAHLPPP